jgi:rhomboid protease GluP
MKNPGSRWKGLLARGMRDGEELLRFLIIANVAMYILSILLSPRSTNFSFNPLFFLSPDSRSLLLLGASGYIPIDRLHRWWSLVSANYLHGSILHLLFNMVALNQIGPLILQEYGNYRMFIIYTLSGVLGFLLSYLAGVKFTIGASAAVCGLIGAALFFGKSRGGVYGQAVYKQISGWAIGIFLFGFLVPAINNWAHGGGPQNCSLCLYFSNSRCSGLGRGWSAFLSPFQLVAVTFAFICAQRPANLPCQPVLLQRLIDKTYKSSGTKDTTSSMVDLSHSIMASRSKPRAMPAVSGICGMETRNFSGKPADDLP